MAASSKKTKSKIIALFIVLAFFAVGGYFSYLIVLKPNVELAGDKSEIILIPSESKYEDLLQILQDENIILDMKSFSWMAKTLKLEENFKPGRYRITNGMNNRQLIKMIKNGKTEKVKLTFNYADHTNDELIEEIQTKLEISSSELEQFFTDENRLMQDYNVDRESVRTLFHPGTYELEWTTHLPELLEFLKKNRIAFWSNERKNKLKRSGLTQAEAIILASIVQSESGIKTEQMKIAGVYLNRLKKSMPLQADPTLIFANGDFTVNRVLKADKEIDSPYNTYKRKGLPPGPICIPFEKSIDAVLNFEKHNYLYFCAKPILNGYSDFSVNYEDHMKLASAYHDAMDKKGILR